MESSEKLRILWLHQFFATPQGWGAVRTYEFARRFVRAGHAVDVVCCAGYDQTLKRTGREPLVVDGMRVFVSGAAYSSHMGFFRRVASFLRFMTGAMWFVMRNGKKYDMCIASSGPLTLAVPALVGRWLWRVPFVFEVIDVWPDSAIAASVLKNPLLKWLSFRLEALAYRYASVIVTCSAGMTERVRGKCGRGDETTDNTKSTEGEVAVSSGSQQYGRRETGDGEVGFSRKGAKTQRGGEGERKVGIRNDELGIGGVKLPVVTISNCCDLEMFVPDEGGRRETRRKYGVGEGQMVVLYNGAMGRSNAMEDVAEAMAATAGDGRIVWWLAGEGPENFCDHDPAALAGQSPAKLRSGQVVAKTSVKKEAEGRQAHAGFENMEEWAFPRKDAKARRREDEGGRARWFGRLAKEEVADLVRAADVNVVTFRHEPLFYENSPNKFFDGIAAGLPAVFNRSTWLEPWLREYDCGVVCDAGEKAGVAMAEALRALAGDPERRQRMGAGARRLAEEVFSRDRLAEEYLGIIATAGQGR